MAPPPRHERYNAKARGSVAGGSSHKKRKRQPVAPVEQEVSDEEARDGGESLAAMARRMSGGEGISTKKRKRLESYIAKKLQLEQRDKNIQLLASLAPKAGTSLSLLSSSTLGQNPLAPTSAQERQEGKEDRIVRRGIERLTKRHGDARGSASESDSEEEEVKGRSKGKGKAKEEVVDMVDGLTGVFIPEAQAGPTSNGKHTPEAKKKKKHTKQSDWNPNLLSTQPDSSSSDFDSSDSEYDGQPEAGPSSPPPPVARSQTQSPVVKLEAPMTATQALSAPKAVAGGALKKSSTGQAVQPRIEVRRKRLRAIPSDVVNDDNEEENEDGEEEDADESEDDDEDETDQDEGEEDQDESSDADSEEAADEEEPAPAPKKRSLGFKAWAQQQMDQITSSQPNLPAESGTETETAKKPQTALSPVPKKPFKPLPKTGQFVGPLGAQLNVPSTSLLDQKTTQSARPAIKRRPSVSEARMNLPILAEEQPIIESILMNPVVVICGETGSGKTTQVPQMLYEHGFGFKGSDNPGMIAVTQPRRVAAVSLATRVKSELNLPSQSSIVAHQIRYSSTTSAETSIKFMTDGVILRELASDFLLSAYSVVVVDEAHERGVNTDVLIGVLSRVAKLREKRWREDPKGTVKPLRIVIMSATLRVDDFTSNPSLFPTPPPVIHISARQHPVTVHFNRRTVSDYVTEAYKKVCKIHARLPPGGILVFMTGQSEIMGLCRQLEKKYSKSAVGGGSGGTAHRRRETTEATRQVEPEVPEAEDIDVGGQDDLAADVDDGDEGAVSDPEGLDSSDDEELGDLDMIDEASEVPMHVLPLYSLLPNDQQMLVFKPPPENHRLVIVSTNVAETSLTIPGIRYVVDSGRAKERSYDPQSGVQSFAVSWISKASAAQRAGRAGRTGPGHCYRLYSSALFENHFEKFSKPEILRMPIEGVVLNMKAMNIDSVVNFPFPTPPDRYALKKAEDLLSHLGALERPTTTRMVAGSQQAGSEGGRITDLGKKMGGYPVSPRFAKMLVVGEQNGCLPYVIAIVACLSVGDPFVHEQALEVDEDEDTSAESSLIRSDQLREKEERKETRRRFFSAQQSFTALGAGSSDLFKMLSAVGAYEYEPTVQFCQKHFLRPKAMQEIQQLRRQISNISKVDIGNLAPPNDTKLKMLRQIITAGFIDQVAVRHDLYLKKPASFTSTRNVPYRALGVPEQVYIHPSSALFHKSPPDFIVFSEVVRSSKVWVKGVTKINGSWLPQLGKGLCTFSRPVEMPGSSTTAAGTGRVKRGKGGEEEREVVVVPHFGALGVDLPPVKKKQRREGTRWVLVD